MTDADPRANGYPPRAEVAPQAPVPVPVNSSPDDASPRVPVHSPEIDQAAETGEPGYGSLAQPRSGGATAWPAWPGVARPAGWFLSVPREAAPLGPADREPARPDNRLPGSGAAWPPGNPAALLAWLPQAPSPREAAPLGPADREPARPDDRLPGSGAASPPGNPAALLAWLPQAPSQEEEPPWPDEDQRGDDWPDYDQYPDEEASPWAAQREDPQATPWREPVVGPTQALRGRAGGPGFRVPAGSGYGPQDPANRSGWQIADGLWRESGIAWDGADDTLADDAPALAGSWDAHPLPGPAIPLGAPTVADAPTRPQAITSEVITFKALTPQAPAPQAGTAQATAPQAIAPQAIAPQETVPQETVPQAVFPQAVFPQAVVPQAAAPPAAPAVPAASPLAAGDLPRRQARPLRPEAPLLRPEAPVPPRGAALHSGMQPAAPPRPPVAPRPPVPPRPPLAQPGQGQWPATAPRSQSVDPRDWRRRFDRPAGLDEQARYGRPATGDLQSDERHGQPAPRPGYQGYQGYQALQGYQAQRDYRDPPGQPPGPSAGEWQPAPRRPRQRQEWEEPRWEDEAVPAFPARRPARGHRVWQVARVTVPVGVILAVGAGALVMLTGKTHAVLASSGNQSKATIGAASTPATAGHGGTPAAAAQPAPLAFPGYPGKQGSESVRSIASAGGVQVAVGSADGHAAIWRRDTGGDWSLVTGATAVTQEPSGTVLTSVTHGQAGWLAVGDVAPVSFGNPGTAQAPVVFTSADGRGWQAVTGSAAFSGPGFQVNAAASNSSGYVVVGSQLQHGKPVDAMWWSPDLKNWIRGGDTIMTTLAGPSSGMTDSAVYAVAATPAGFIAVGTHADCHTAWATADGHHWQSYDIPKPAGTTEPLLNHVAVTGQLVVATGDIAAGAGRYPLAVTSADGGVHWRTTSLGGPGDFSGPHGTVTALAADGTGFLAAGLAGQQAVTWTSPDGIAWSAAMPASGGGTQQITVLAADGNAVTRIATLDDTHGNRSVAVTAPVP